MIVRMKLQLTTLEQGINIQAIVDVRSEADGYFPKKLRTWYNNIKWI